MGKYVIGMRVSKQRWIKPLIGGMITFLCLFVFFRQISLPDVLEALENFRWAYLILGLASLVTGYALRITRWSMMLKAAGAHVTFANCSAPFLGSIALNNVLPLRLGDVMRALIFPSAMGITRTIAASSLVIERLIDLMALLANMALGIFFIEAIAIPSEVKNSAIFFDV